MPSFETGTVRRFGTLDFGFIEPDRGRELFFHGRNYAQRRNLAIVSGSVAALNVRREFERPRGKI